MKLIRIIKIVLIFALIQFVIIFFIVKAINDNKLADFTNTFKKDIKISTVRLVEPLKNRSKIYIFDGSEDYLLNCVHLTQKEAEEAFAILKKESNISVIAYRSKLSSEEYTIVDARSKDYIYLDINEYNKHHRSLLTGYWVMFGFFELFYLLILGIFILINR